EIKLLHEPLRSAIYTHRIWKLPFLRGLVVLIEQLHLGTKSLLWSATASTTSTLSEGEEEVSSGRLEVAIGVGVGVLFSVGLFIGLPLLGASLAVRNSGGIAFVLVEGLIRVVLVLAYLALIGLLSDVYRVFQYHGAEHKTINAFEAEWELTPASAARASTLHPRCGTGFLIVVLVVSLLLFAVVAGLHPNWPELVISRLAGIPVIAAVSYEWIRLLASAPRNWAVRALLWPILQTQRLTTRQPDERMLEVAITSFKAVLERDRELVDAPAPLV
ncbi:MAG: DUF1385 domain-containing protein, partial [Candidatus Dormibacteraceae bacterium]